MIKRTIELNEILETNHILLLGPRQTGKSTLLKHTFSKSLYLDLLDPELFRDLIYKPNILKEIVHASDHKIVIIDEIQKVPELLDVVHQLMECEGNYKFILSGSSARKLKSKGTNLLGGRAFPLFLHPITSKEFFEFTDKKRDLIELITIGGLPAVLTSKKPLRLLKAYTGIYLQEEIKAEALVRKLGDFSRFLEVAALTNTEQLDFTSVANDVQLSPKTVSSYYQILQDTLTGYLLEPFKKTFSRKTFSTPKFYFFDTGIVHFLQKREKLPLGTPEYGKALEHFIFCELMAYKNYNEKNSRFYYKNQSR